jgi:hypothetical protein
MHQKTISDHFQKKCEDIIQTGKKCLMDWLWQMDMAKMRLSIYAVKRQV